MFQSNVVNTDDSALAAFKEISQKLEYDSDSHSFSGAEFFDSMSETVVVSDFSDYDSSKTYLVAYAENILDSANKTILRQYFFNNSANKTPVPITKNLLTISSDIDTNTDTIIVMKKVPVNYNKYPDNVPVLFSIKDSGGTFQDGELAVLVDGELRGQLSKGTDNNYLGLVTYGHPGQLHNNNLGSTDEQKLKITFQFNSGDNEWPYSKINLGSTGFNSYFHVLADNYYALKAEGALYRNGGVITPLELTLQALTQQITLNLSAGWSLIAIPYISDVSSNNTRSNIFGTNDQYIVSMSKYDGSYFDIGTNTTVTNSLGYWIKLSQATNITIEGNLHIMEDAFNNNLKALTNGWYLLSFPFSDSTTTGEKYLLKNGGRDVTGNNVNIFKSMSKYEDTYSDISFNTTIEKGLGYWALINNNP